MEHGGTQTNVIEMVAAKGLISTFNLVTLTLFIGCEVRQADNGALGESIAHETPLVAFGSGESMPRHRRQGGPLQ